MAAQLFSSFVGESVPFSVSFFLEKGNDGNDAKLPISSPKMGDGD